MNSFEHLSQQFAKTFNQPQFPATPATLYQPNEYFLQIGGKRVRPVLCLMGNELFDDIKPEAYEIATAIELFHNFTLIHDDIMDNAPLRRGMQTIHTKYDNSTAILCGDVMLVRAYEHLSSVQSPYLTQLLHLFNTTARQVCEGQQMDMDFEKQDNVSQDDYLKMIELKTSVLIAASLKLGAIIGGASQRNQDNIYQFGLNLGLAFQVQDDYLDAFGDPEKFGKQVGGDILANKKTFLLIHALETANAEQKLQLEEQLNNNHPDKVAKVLQLYRDCKVDDWALQLKNTYLDKAFNYLEEIAVLSARKQPLLQLAEYLVKRDV